MQRQLELKNSYLKHNALKMKNCIFLKKFFGSKKKNGQKFLSIFENFCGKLEKFFLRFFFHCINIKIYTLLIIYIAIMYLYY